MSRNRFRSISWGSSRISDGRFIGPAATPAACSAPAACTGVRVLVQADTAATNSERLATRDRLAPKRGSFANSGWPKTDVARRHSSSERIEMTHHSSSPAQG